MDIAQTQQDCKELLKNIQHPRLGAVLGLHEEVGELAKVLMNWEVYGEQDQENLREECADVLFSLIDVCNAYGINLDAAATAKIADTRKHIAQWESKYGERLRSLRSQYDHEL